MHAQFLRNFMAEKVPVTSAMAIEVVDSSVKGVTLKASIEANINDKGVAFGGSLFSAASLCSWAVIDFILKQNHLEANIFVHTSQSKFSAPVLSDFTVFCPAPSKEQIATFLNSFNRKGRARLTLRATIYENEMLAFESVSDFVAVKK
ncbi:MAG: thioesterase domain-containing protein [Candidatus Paracaedibacteraceae bacterium]|nr:thioesterase domain-containing protein [Candidatus Paracaedibacteraceae bacterium]